MQFVLLLLFFLFLFIQALFFHSIFVVDQTEFLKQEQKLIYKLYNNKLFKTIPFQAMQKHHDSQPNQVDIEIIERKMGCWSFGEQTKYIQFLRKNRKLLQSRQQRKNSKIFKLMADFIGSRDGIQCRSHHIKQMRTHRQIRKIIDFYTQNKSSPQLCNQNLQPRKKQLEENSEPVINPRAQFKALEGTQENFGNGLSVFWSAVPFYGVPSNNYQYFSQFRFDYSSCVPIMLVTGTLPMQTTYNNQ